LTNDSPDLYALILRIVLRKNYSFLAWLPGISNSNENYRSYNFHAFANISGNFPEISKNFRKIYNPICFHRPNVSSDTEQYSQIIKSNS